MRKKLRLIGWIIVCVFISAVGSIAVAQEPLWKPTSAIKLIVPSRPGGGHDNTARVFAKYAKKYLGQPLSIVNQPAGAGVVAYSNLLKAEPDGHTLLQTSISLVSDQYLVKGAKYNQDSFKYVCQIASDPNHLVVSKGGPYDMSVKDFLAFAKNNPNKIRMGVSGNWTNHDYVRFQIEQAGGVKFQRVSIKGGANVVMAILAGDLDAGVPYPSEIRSQVEAGKLKILAHSGAERLDLWPDVPTFTELGLGVDLYIWRAIAVPGGTPDYIVNGLYEIFKKVMTDPETKQGYKDVGIGYAFKGPKETTLMIQKSHDKYKSIIDSANLMKK